MDQKTENNINFTEKLITLLKENKTKIFTLLFIVIVICACFVFLKIMNQKKIESSWNISKFRRYPSLKKNV